MEKKILIKKKEVLREVMKATSYLAARKSGTEQNPQPEYLKIVATESDSEMLMRFYDESVESLRSALAEYLQLAELSLYEGIELTLTMPENWKDGTLNLDDRALYFCANYTTSKWLELSSKEDAEVFMQNAQSDLALIVGAVGQRNRPVRNNGISLYDAKCECPRYKQLVMTINKDEAYHDIKQTAYTYAHALAGEGITAELKHNIYDLCESGNIDITARLLDQAVTDCNATLARFMKDDEVDSLNNDWNECQGNPQEKSDYTLSVFLPESFAMRYAKPIFNNIVVYITNKVLASWLTIVYPSGVEQFTAVYSDAQQKLEEYSRHLKPGTVRIVPRWF